MLAGYVTSIKRLIAASTCRIIQKQVADRFIRETMRKKFFQIQCYLLLAVMLTQVIFTSWYFRTDGFTVRLFDLTHQRETEKSLGAGGRPFGLTADSMCPNLIGLYPIGPSALLSVLAYIYICVNEMSLNWIESFHYGRPCLSCFWLKFYCQYHFHLQSHPRRWSASFIWSLKHRFILVRQTMVQKGCQKTTPFGSRSNLVANHVRKLFFAHHRLHRWHMYPLPGRNWSAKGFHGNAKVYRNTNQNYKGEHASRTPSPFRSAALCRRPNEEWLWRQGEAGTVS